jgi:hypothetical protein
VLSVGKSAGGNTVARSLNRAAVNRGMLSVLIQVQPEFVGAEPSAGKWQGGAVIAGVQAVNELLDAGKKPGSAPTDDIRSEFDLIIVHATSLALQPDAITLAAHADLIIPVVRAAELGSGAMRRITAALSRFAGVPSGLVINHAPGGSAAPEGNAMGMAV